MEDRREANAQRRRAQIPRELKISNYEGRMPLYVEILATLSVDKYTHRSYFPHPTEKNMYICYITTEMAHEYNVALPEGARTVELFDPLEYAVKGSKSQSIMRRLAVVYVQSLPPNGFRVAKVTLT